MTKPRKPRTPRVAPSYLELLRDPRWQRRKSEIMDRDGWECVNCGEGDKNLQVHHSSYVYGRMPWEYDDCSLTTLCEDCHEEETANTKAFKAALLRLPPGRMERLTGYVEAMASVTFMGGDEPAARLHVKSDEHCQGIASYFGLTDEDVYAAFDEDNTVCPERLEVEGAQKEIEVRRAKREARYR